MSTSKFDDKIGKIIFCAPPFHGALRPIRVIEAGAGTPLDGYPFLVPPSSIRRSVATMPGLFQLVVAPRSAWPTEVQQRNGTKRHLKYPIRTPESLYRTGAWSNTYRLDLRNNLVDGAKQYHLRKWAQIENVVRRIGEKISIIVGLNGQTLYSATRSNSRKWVLHKVSKPTRGQYSNGDGTVLFQSSLLPGLPSNRYWAEISPKYRNFHGELMDRPNVIAGVESILASTDVNGAGLIRYHEFIDDVDWSLESVDSTDPRTTDSLDYTERANLRLATPRQQWQSKLNPGGRDAELYYVTREAALQVLAGGDLHAEADRIGQSPEFLKEHLRTLLMPILYS